MEDYHVNKPPPGPLTEAEIKDMNDWIMSAKTSNENTIMDASITSHEVEGTFSTCSGASGHDGVSAKLIDNAEKR